MKGPVPIRLLRFAIAAALATAGLAPPAALANCGAENCPFVRRGLGNEYGRLSFDLRLQEITQDQLWEGSSETTLDQVIAGAEAHGEVELYTKTRSWVGEVRGAINDRVSVVATLPFLEREHHHWLRHTPVYNPLFLDVWNYQGLGDLSVVGRYDVRRGAAGTGLSLLGGLKLPTGRRHVPDETRDNFGYESTLEPSVRPGTGSTDWIVGASGSRALPWRRALPLAASVLAKFNTRGTDNFRVGNELQVGLAGGWAPIARLTLLGQVNYSRHGSDVSADPSEAAHTGMRSLYLTPGVSVNVAGGVSLYGLYQVRVWGESDEATVVAKSHALIGTSFPIIH
jgi:hypothetical protein